MTRVEVHPPLQITTIGPVFGADIDVTARVIAPTPDRPVGRVSAAHARHQPGSRATGGGPNHLDAATGRSSVIYRRYDGRYAPISSAADGGG